MMGERNRVGPVLEAGLLAESIVIAIRALNDDVEVIDRGAYWRVTAPRRCVLTSAAVEEQSGHTFHLPGDLERVMTSFVGRFSVDEDQAVWLAAGDDGS